MLTREQWENLARFAGVAVPLVDTPWEQLRADKGYFRLNCDGTRVEWSWQPLADWRDFGPLLVLIVRWERTYCVPLPYRIARPLDAYQDAKYRGTDREIMEAGCALGAAIGATMKAPA